jgi:GR25 family glycosyltransferase involved in LPS biosynthesis
LLKKAYDEGINNLLMLEDDIEFSVDFNEILSKTGDFFHKNTWDCIYLGGYHNKSGLFKITKNLYKTTNSGGTHGWICKIQKIYPLIAQYGPIAPIDTIMSMYVQQHLNCYAINPSIINQKSGWSYMEQCDLTKPSRYIGDK